MGIQSGMAPVQVIQEHEPIGIDRITLSFRPAQWIKTGIGRTIFETKLLHQGRGRG